MGMRVAWTARVWPVYLLAGIAWVVFGAVALGDPRGLGLIFIGLACLAIGGHGVQWRLARGYGLVRPLPSGLPPRD